MTGNIRAQAIAAVASTKLAPVPEGLQDPETVFGSDVFGYEAMKEYLPKAVFRSLKRTIEKGAAFDPAVADVVAVEQAVVLKLAKRDFDAIAKKQPKLLETVEVGRRAREAESRAVPGRVGSDRMKWLPLLALAACIDAGPGPQPKKIDRKLIAANLLTAVPANVSHLDVSLGGRVEYVGTIGASEVVIPGQTTRITHVWQVLIPPGPGWRVFAQLRGDPGTADFMNLDETDLELGHPVASWRAGEIISDPLDFTLRPD